MIPRTFSSFHDAYAGVLEAITERPDQTISTRGNTSAELLDVSFRISNPRDRLPYLVRRPVNIAYNLAEALWYLGGRNDLDMIGYYAPGMSNYSADGHTLTGSAYGWELFQHGPDGMSQWDRVIRLLTTDPDTKRATVTFFRPEELAIESNPDVSCTIAAQFLLRDGRLHLTSYMRGNDAYMGMVSDVYAFTFMMEFAAAQLGVDVGHYSHHVGSMHINDRDMKNVRRLLNEARQDGYQRPAFDVLRMPTASDWNDIETVLAHEAILRANREPLTSAKLQAVALGPYWQQVLLVFEVYRQIKHTDAPVQAATLAALDPGYEWLVRRRWANRMPKEAE
uniref:thymidylate synthase n=1 Tax=Herbidospora sakaeratensis TaxID=564415 RepID=UPI000783BD67|nr:thymidylate synthase [Herbidospora sakaeratensis]